MIDKDILKMNTKEFLNNLKNFFEKYLGENSSEKASLLEYLPEDKWLEIKKQCLLTPFLPEEYGGRTPDQK